MELQKASTPIEPAAAPDAPEPELSVVIPCLNESETLAACIGKAREGIAEAGVEAEIVIADNGSTDGSVEIAERMGARVVHVREPGYGSALMGGIAASRGRYVLMGDADDSYDFREVPKFLAELRRGFELVQGCRLPAGGGRVAPGAMPLTHRWIGNPLFTLLVRRWFRAPIHDVYCGLRGFSRQLFDRLHLRCTGMEFATEMIIKSSLRGARIAEVPITLHPDGRVAAKPHLRTIRDGWRTLRFFLLFSPRWLFLLPGVALILLGLGAYAVALPGVRVGAVEFGPHTLLFGSVAVLIGHQALLSFLAAQTFAVNEGLIPEGAWFRRFFRFATLERGIVLSAAALLAGLALLAAAVGQWRAAGFGALDYARTMRWVIPGATLTMLGFQTLMMSFFISLLGLQRR